MLLISKCLGKETIEMAVDDGTINIIKFIHEKLGRYEQEHWSK